jgi:hypothetical protein
VRVDGDITREPSEEEHKQFESRFGKFAEWKRTQKEARWHAICKSILKEMVQADMRNKTFVISPLLTLTGASLTEYKSKILHPMDYSTVDAKGGFEVVKSNTVSVSSNYQDPNEFVDDMRFIYSNCVTFNPPYNIEGRPHEYYEFGVSQSAKFERLLAEKTAGGVLIINFIYLFH